MKVTWDAWRQSKSEQMGTALMHLRTGAAYAEGSTAEGRGKARETERNLSRMSKEELKEFYLAMAKKAGVDIDPSLLDRDKDKGDPEQPGTQQDS